MRIECARNNSGYYTRIFCIKFKLKRIKMKNKKQANKAQVELGRGTIKDNFLAAMVTSKLYKQQIVQAKKGKGSYQRKAKFSNKGKESYLIAA